MAKAGGHEGGCPGEDPARDPRHVPAPGWKESLKNTSINQYVTLLIFDLKSKIEL
jgi:hypothetical protein